MDPEDPIQQLLKNTGWSCDDLLARLQQLKSAKSNEEQTTAETSQENLTSQINSTIKDSFSEEAIPGCPEEETEQTPQIPIHSDPKHDFKNPFIKDLAYSNKEGNVRHSQNVSTSQEDLTVEEFSKSSFIDTHQQNLTLQNNLKDSTAELLSTDTFGNLQKVLDSKHSISQCDLLSQKTFSDSSSIENKTTVQDLTIRDDTAPLINSTTEEKTGKEVQSNTNPENDSKHTIIKKSFIGLLKESILNLKKPTSHFSSQIYSTSEETFQDVTTPVDLDPQINENIEEITLKSCAIETDTKLQKYVTEENDLKHLTKEKSFPSSSKTPKDSTTRGEGDSAPQIQLNIEELTYSSPDTETDIKLQKDAIQLSSAETEIDNVNLKETVSHGDYLPQLDSTSSSTETKDILQNLTIPVDLTLDEITYNLPDAKSDKEPQKDTISETKHSTNNESVLKSFEMETDVHLRKSISEIDLTSSSDTDDKETIQNLAASNNLAPLIDLTFEEISNDSSDIVADIDFQKESNQLNDSKYSIIKTSLLNLLNETVLETKKTLQASTTHVSPDTEIEKDAQEDTISEKNNSRLSTVSVSSITSSEMETDVVSKKSIWQIESTSSPSKETNETLENLTDAVFLAHLINLSREEETHVSPDTETEKEVQKDTISENNSKLSTIDESSLKSAETETDVHSSKSISQIESTSSSSIEAKETPENLNFGGITYDLPDSTNDKELQIDAISENNVKLSTINESFLKSSETETDVLSRKSLSQIESSSSLSIDAKETLENVSAPIDLAPLSDLAPPIDLALDEITHVSLDTENVLLKKSTSYEDLSSQIVSTSSSIIETKDIFKNLPTSVDLTAEVITHDSRDEEIQKDKISGNNSKHSTNNDSSETKTDVVHSSNLISDDLLSQIDSTSTNYSSGLSDTETNWKTFESSTTADDITPLINLELQKDTVEILHHLTSPTDVAPSIGLTIKEITYDLPDSETDKELQRCPISEREADVHSKNVNLDDDLSSKTDSTLKKNSDLSSKETKKTSKAHSILKKILATSSSIAETDKTLQDSTRLETTILQDSTTQDDLSFQKSLTSKDKIPSSLDKESDIKHQRHSDPKKDSTNKEITPYLFDRKINENLPFNSIIKGKINSSSHKRNDFSTSQNEFLKFLLKNKPPTFKEDLPSKETKIRQEDAITQNDDSGDAESFSYTDEEESEENVTNSHIINEIIEDLSVIDCSKTDLSVPIVDTLSSHNYESEVTEVQVIEVNEEKQWVEDKDEPKTLKSKKSCFLKEIHPRTKIEPTQNHLSDLKEMRLPTNMKLVKKLPISPPAIVAGPSKPNIFLAATPVVPEPNIYTIKRKGPRMILPKIYPQNRIVKLRRIKKTNSSDSNKNIKNVPKNIKIVKRYYLQKVNPEMPALIGNVIQPTGQNPCVVQQSLLSTTRHLVDVNSFKTFKSTPHQPQAFKTGLLNVNRAPREAPYLLNNSNVLRNLLIPSKSTAAIKLSQIPLSKKDLEPSQVPCHVKSKLTEDTNLSVTEIPTSQPYILSTTGNIPSQANSNNEINTSEKPTVENVEDPRNSLKLLLNSLRNRKKNNILFNISSTKLTDNIECSKKLSLLENAECAKNNEIRNSDIKETRVLDSEKFSVPSTKKDIKGKNKASAIPEDIFEGDFAIPNASSDPDPEHEKEFNDSSVYTETGELGLVILDVQGGVELDESLADEKDDFNIQKSVVEEDIQNSNFNTDENSVTNLVSNSNNAPAKNSGEEIEDIGVFDQIRKIINKHKISKVKNLSKNDSKTLPQKSTHPKNEDKIMEISPLSGDNSQSSFLESSATEEKSPFVSDSLDEFLTSSQLKISYQVPKLAAESLQKNSNEIVTNNYLDETSPLILKKVEHIKVLPGETTNRKIIKAKTLAQKRRILERERKKELKKLDKQREKELKTEEQKLKNEELKEKYKDKGYILFDDKKIFVNSVLSNVCLARINCSKSKNGSITLSPQKKKWSLLYSESKKRSNIRYRPGPLSQKPNLQISGSEQWESRILNAPQVTLEVTPEFKKPFCDDVFLRLSSIIGGELNEEKIDFALSMVQERNKADAEDKPKIFRFPLHFHNNVEHILGRCKKPTPAKRDILKTVKPVENLISKDPIADVIEDLIKYIEIKELAPTLIKDDDAQVKVDEKLCKLTPTASEDNVSVFKKTSKKRSKVELELLRLNCKVVNVEVEETDEGICQKPYCKLGCICKSLKCENIPTSHCQKVACMFKCTCPIEKPYVYDNITLPAGTNILSEDAVSRIEGEAKKNLAKVEREFTQTVIHTNDKTIVVGIGSRTKTRRSAKHPIKFTDFVNSDEAIPDEDKLTQDCKISLTKLDLSQIIPYCWTHDLYSCYCKGQALYKPKCTLNVDDSAPKSKMQHTPSDNITSLNPVPPKKCKVVEDITEEPIPVQERQRDSGPHKLRPKVPKKYIFGDDFAESHEKKRKPHLPVVDNKAKKIKLSTKPKEIVSPQKFYDSSSLDNSNDSSSSDRRPLRTIKKPFSSFSEDFIEYKSAPQQSSCKRVKPVSIKYLKSYKYTNDIFDNDFINNISDSDLFRLKIQRDANEGTTSEAELLKQALIQEKMSGTSKKNKRKQTLISRRDEFLGHPEKLPLVSQAYKEDSALQRRKKPPSQPVPVPKSDEIISVFEGEIIVGQQNMELLTKMGPKTVAEGYARLLPWTALIHGFQNNSISIWSMINVPSRLLINKSDKKCPKNYINIIDTARKTEVIRWILNNQLPPQYNKDTLSFILKETKDNYEICGICTKNITDDMLRQSEEGEEAVKVTNNEEIEKQTKELNEIFHHRDMNGKELRLTLTTEKQVQTYNVVNFKPLTDYDESHSLLVKLPDIYTVCKWRMVCLKSDFTYLVLKNSLYSIRYTDLLAISQYARKNKCTVSLKNKDLQKGYDHMLFGIYFDGHCFDRIFVGPYFITQKPELEDDVETFRYINKALVSTENFNKMTGNKSYQSGYWLIQAKKKVQPCLQSSGTIDLTLESKLPPVVKKKQSPFIAYKDSDIKIIDSQPRKPEEFNRFIITNIPHFGYLGAFRHPNAEIDVSWPFENKLLRFKNESYATSFLQERFSSLLQSVPESFKITIIVATTIDLEKHKPINSNVLNGHYICGSFGCYDVLSLSDSEHRIKVGCPKEEVLKLFAKRAQLFVRKRVEELADLLDIPKLDNGYDLQRVLNSAQREIAIQTAKQMRLTVLKEDIALKKRSNVAKIYNILLSLPPEQRNIENLKFRSILHRTESIEIHDSDEETNNGNKVFKTPSAVPFPNRMKMTSVLKPIFSGSSTSVLLRGESPASTSTETMFKSPHKKLVKGVKLVKTSTGFVIVDNDPQNMNLSPSSTVNKLIVKNNNVKNLTSPVNTPTQMATSSFLSLSEMLSSSPAIDVPVSDPQACTSSSVTVSNVPEEELNNVDEIIDLDKNDLDNNDLDNYPKITELHIVGNKVVQKGHDNLHKDVLSASNVGVSKFSIKNINSLREPMIIDLDDFPEDSDTEKTTNNEVESKEKHVDGHDSIVSLDVMPEIINLDSDEEFEEVIHLSSDDVS